MKRVIAAVLVGSTLLATAQDEAKAPGFAWLAGTWRVEDGVSIIEEIWSLPHGDSQVGSFRWVNKGEPRLYELIVIERTKDGVFLRLRHFGPGLVPWKSEAKGPLSWKLKESKAKEALFENERSRVLYRREGDRELLFRLESKGEQPQQIRFRRK